MTNQPTTTHNRYPAYKPSGIDWLGDIPAHWEVVKGKWLFEKNDRPVRKEDGVVTAFRDGQVTLWSNRREEGFTNAIQEHGYQGIRKGDLVIHAMDAFAGAIGVSESDGKSSPVYAACTPRVGADANPYFFAYFLRHLAKTGFIESLAKGIRERSTDFRFKDFGLLDLSVPPLAEQTRIAEFLDQKTAQIDQAIAQKERLIELLNERRQVLIHRAITRGLNPDVPTKPSGIEWIGDIPAHWEVKKLKYVLTERNDKSDTGLETIFMVSQEHGLVVRANYHDKAIAGQSSVGSKRVFYNDLVFNKLKAHLGVFFKSTVDEVGLVSPDYAVYLSNGVIEDLKFLELLFRHPAYIRQFICNATGIVEGLIRLYTSELFNIKIPIPPKKEQQEILNTIHELTLKVEDARKKTQREIILLHELKSTLINSAVTGKIRV